MHEEAATNFIVSFFFLFSLFGAVCRADKVPIGTAGIGQNCRTASQNNCSLNNGRRRCNLDLRLCCCSLSIALSLGQGFCVENKQGLVEDDTETTQDGRRI
jgi:hypothetical protein